MKLTPIVPVAFFFGFVGTICGSFLKILHREGADTLLAIGLIATATFIITAVYEVVSSSRIRQLEKVMWTIAFILGGTITGMIYMIIGRRRVTSRG